MPFLNQLSRWAELRPTATAIEVGPHRLGFGELRDRAASGLDNVPALSMLSEPNGVEFAIRFAAAVAGDRSCAVLDPDWPEAQRSIVEERLRQAIPDAGAAAADTGLRDGPADSVFLHGFTSGTTSMPKAFGRTRGSWPLAASAKLFGLTRHGRTLAPGPLSATLNLYALAESLHAGAAFFTLPSFDVGAALECVRSRKINRLVAVPTVLRLIGERALAADVDGTKVTSIVSAGSKLDPTTLALVRRWAPNATLFEYYGAAELSFVSVSVLRPGDPADPSPTAVGRAFPGVSIQIRGDDGAVCDAGATGDIYVRSSQAIEGYTWGDDGKAFRRDGRWCTAGDRGYLDDDSVLHFRGRRADMIVTAGQNVYPQEVESVLGTVPGLETILVTGIPDEARGTRVVAAVLASQTTDAAGLRAASTDLLGGAKRPRSYYRLTEVPVTPAGKPSRRLLRQWIEEADPRVGPLA